MYNYLLEFGIEVSTLVDLLRWRATHQSNDRAYTFLIDGETDETHITYQELDQQARAIAAALQQRKAAGERVLLLYPPGLAYIAAFFGCLYAGAIAVPSYPPRFAGLDPRLKAIMENSGTKIIITDEMFYQFAQSLFPQNPVLAALDWIVTNNLDLKSANQWQPPAINGDTLAFLQYTSGSTATPKGVMVSHKNLLYNEEMVRLGFGHNDQTIFVGWLPLYHDMGLIGNVLQPLYLGIPCTLMSPLAFIQKPLRWLQAITRYKATTSGGPNFAYDLCVRKTTPAEREHLDLSSWRVAFNGAEPIRASTLQAFTETFASCGFRAETFYPCYGLAEATLFVTGDKHTALPETFFVEREALAANQFNLIPPNTANSQPSVSNGVTWLDQKIVIVNPETLTLSPPSEIGEIWVSGENIAHGYWQQPEQTAQTFKAHLADTGEGPFMRTGDLGILHQGKLLVTGRLKDLVIVRGRNHYPQDIELTVEQSHPTLRPGCCGVFQLDQEGEDHLIVVQEVRKEYEDGLDTPSIFEAIREAVAKEHELELHTIVLIKAKSIPKTSSGKIQRHACRQKFLADKLKVIEIDQPQAQLPQKANLLALFDVQARQRPNKLAVVQNQLSLSYQQLNEQANHVAHHLQKEGVQPGDVVGLYTSPSPEMMAGLLGILKAEGICLPIPQNSSDLHHLPTKAHLLIPQKGDKPYLPADWPHTIILDALMANKKSEAQVPQPILDETAPALVITDPHANQSAPPLTHQDIIAYFSQVQSLVNLGAEETWLSGLAPVDWLALIELLGALTSGATVILAKPAYPTKPARVDFSLFYFSSNEAAFTENKYKLFIEGAKYADEHNFTAIWTPERHFHAFGGLYPNPSVLSAALATKTERIRLRAGSVVLPLHNPIRVVEEWSVVDNLSHGRVDLAVAQGWNPNDFVLFPTNYEGRTEIMLAGIETLQALWQGEPIRVNNGVGQETEVRVYPLPQQPKLDIWLTCSGNIERFVNAGAAGVHILTALLFQTVEELGEKLAAYRQARLDHGHNPDAGKVTLMLHTFVSEDMQFVRDTIRAPFLEYLKTSVNLWRQASKNLDELNPTEREKLLEFAFERYSRTSALFGTPESCLKMVNELRMVGVDEIACLFDFIPDSNVVLDNLPSLNRLRQLANTPAAITTPTPEAVNDLIGKHAITLVHAPANITSTLSSAACRVLVADEVTLEDSSTVINKATRLALLPEQKRPHSNQTNQTGRTALTTAPATDSALSVPSQSLTTTPTPSSTSVSPEKPPERPVSTDDRTLLRWTQSYFVHLLAQKLSRATESITVDKNFTSLGVDSLKAVDLIDYLSDQFNVSLSPAVLFEAPTVARLAEYFVQNHAPLLRQFMLKTPTIPTSPTIQPEPVAPAPVVPIVPTTSPSTDGEGDQTGSTPPVAQTKLVSVITATEGELAPPTPDKLSVSTDLAIIGLACHFPKAKNIHQFWQLLRDGENAIQEVPPSRWDWRAYYDENGGDGNKTYSRWGGFLDDIDQFDARFFDISPREAKLMDPQQRLFLEIAWQTMEHGGYAPQSFAELKANVGVFVGCSNTTYYERLKPFLGPADHSAGVGNQNAIIANGVSYFMNLHGPSLLVDTMCSSSLVAIHLARQSILRGDCNMALVGGVNTLLSPEYYVAMSRMKAHAPDGQCKTFDYRANGIVFGEGAGAILLKPLEAALRDSDTVYAVIKGSAVNHDGRSNGLTAPNPAAQANLIRTALAEANLSADTISYIEAHGTGTNLGDPIEIEGLTQAFREDTSREQFCAIGSLKTNIGHLEPAAGIAGVIKLVLAMQNRQLPPSLNFERPNPMIPFETSPFKVNTTLSDWVTDGPRRAGVSSFGIGGTNAHVILEEASLKKTPPQVEKQPAYLLTLSAKSEAALKMMVDDYAQFLNSQPNISLADLCFTSNVSRSYLSRRLSLVTSSLSTLQGQLAAYQKGQKVTELQKNRIYKQQIPTLAFLFTGQGSQYPEMGADLYHTQPVFRQTLEECHTLLTPHLDVPLLDILYDKNVANTLLNQTIYAQPALFALEYALYKMWQSWGIDPDIVMGHSVGEYVAACVSGVFSLEDGLKLITARGRLMQSLPPNGAMAAIFADLGHVEQIIAPFGDEVAIAAINGPHNVVISGQANSVASILSRLENVGLRSRTLNVSHAFHSPLLEPILDEFEALAQTISFKPPQIPLVSNLTGSMLRVNQVQDARYWREHMRAPVQFEASIHTLVNQGYNLFLEIGPSSTLIRLAKDCMTFSSNCWLSSLTPKRQDWERLIQTLGELYVQGLSPKWAAVYQGQPAQRIALPNYPFEHQSYWVNLPSPATPAEASNGTTPTSTPASVTSSTNQIQSSSGQAPQKTNQYTFLLKQITHIVGQLLEMEPDQVDIYEPFLEMGADSLVLVNAVQIVEREFGLHLTIQQLFEDLSTINQLVFYLNDHLTLDITPEAVPTPPPSEQTTSTAQTETVSETSSPSMPDVTPTVADTGLQSIFNQQLELLAQVMNQQLSLLGQQPTLPAKHQPAPAETPPPSPAVTPGQKPTPPATGTLAAQTTAVYQPRTSVPAQSNFNRTQAEHVTKLISRYTKRTQRSKIHTQTYRATLVDSRASAGFRPSIKEMLYPIVADHAQGAHIWDVDGNKYIDICMGFGVNLLGHSPSFVTEAVERQLQQGMPLGPQTSLAGEVAELIHQLTGMERSAFCNSGTEAVMTAIRLARTKTRRDKIVLFSQAYHGSFDGVLALPTLQNGFGATPMAPGVPPNIVKDVLVLAYDNPESLKIIEAHAHELAAVLVEPVQSRRPDLQPREFLQALRQITRQAGVALIFDEMITGFRIHQGGAQAHFGVEADIATYGKIVGGGLPIGIISGKADYLNAIDGGVWQYGDASYPQAETTFFAGTFCKHPLAMAAAKATLTHLKSQGNHLQEALNHQTTYLVNALNTYFEAQSAPLSVVQFGSLFRFAFKQNLDLFFYHLLDKGVYVWEGRNFFLSTAHTQDDVEAIIEAVKYSIVELQQGDFLPTPAGVTFQKTESPSPETSNGPTEALAQQFHLQKGAPNLKTVPLTAAQKQLWVLEAIHKQGSLAYNERMLLRFNGSLNLTWLQQAIQETIHQHEALRTFIDPEGGVQYIRPQLTIEIPQFDQTRGTKEEREAALSDLLQTEANQAFDLFTGPLIRVCLIKRPRNQHLLLLTVHHIIADGWSLGLLLQEIGERYLLLSRGKESLLPAPIQFSTYIQQQKAAKYSQTIQAHRAYWLAKFAAKPPLLELPTDYPRPATVSFNGKRQSRVIQAPISQSLRTFSKRHKSTLFMTLIGCYALLLHRLSKQDDVVIGFPVANRSTEEGEGLIGYCTHMVALRSQIQGNPTFANYLQQLRTELFSVYEHQTYPFAWLVNELDLDRDTSRAPLISAVFNMENVMDVPELPGLKVNYETLPVSYVKFDLSLNITEIGNELILDLDYNTDLFEDSTIERWHIHLQTLFNHIVRNPHQPVHHIPLLTAVEYEHLLKEWNQTEQNYPQHRCLHALFEQQVAQTPNKVALVFANQAYTYRELNERANQLARHLREAGVTAETRVALFVERSLEMMVGLWGILKAGGCYIPLDPIYPPERLAYLLDNAQASFIVTQTALTNKLPAYTPRQIYLDRDWPTIASHAKDNVATNVTSQSLAYIIYTSGSTGKPKGVQIEHRTVVNFLNAMAKEPGIEADDYLLAVTTLTFDIAVLELLLPLMNGATVEVADQETSRDGFRLKETLTTNPITMMQATPATWRMLLDTGWMGKPDLKILCGGEALPRDLATQLLPCGDSLWNLYGPTETTIWSTVAQIMPTDKIISVGHPLDNTQIYLLDPFLEPVPIGVPGQLYIGGAGLARGYWQKPDLTATSFIPNPFSNMPGARLYNTGDTARYRADGGIEFMGRRDYQVKIRGFRIELGEIEALLNKQGGVHEAVVVAPKNANGIPQIGAYVVPDHEKPVHKQTQEMAFSLFYFAADSQTTLSAENYTLYQKSARFADEHGFTAIWTPERHFHEVGGQYPSPSLLSASLATITNQIQLRAGSVVLPLHHPIRVAEEWSVVDNLSQGRVGISFTAGWHPVDFTFYPENYANRKEIMLQQLDQINRLWRGEGIQVQDGAGHEATVKIFPRPVQADLPIWMTCAGNPETFTQAGELGTHILTHLLSQSIDELAEKLGLYREARAKAGYNPETGQVTLMLHTFVWPNQAEALKFAREPFCNYLKAHVGLLKVMAQTLDIPVDLNSEEDLNNLVQFAFERYAQSASLIGTPQYCLETIKRLQTIGVTEVACLIDFGIEDRLVLQSLDHINHLRHLSQQTDLALENRLRQALQAVLPTYMLPSFYMFLDKLPLTPNQKIDRKALPVPDFSQMTRSKPIVAAETPTEQTLVKIWQETLGLPHISRTDNFFQLGGDSILSIQIIRKASEAGIHITPTQMFKYQTVAELARAAETRDNIEASQELIMGEAPLTPIQHWFFAQNLQNRDHYNQSVLLTVHPPIQSVHLEKIIQHLVNHHDALRLRFEQEETTWRQHHVPLTQTTYSTVVDLTALSAEDKESRFIKEANETQASLRLSDGPLIRATLFRFGYGQPDKLLIAIHHLAVDGISWRILLEDIETLHRQLQTNQSLKLPLKGTAFKYWAESLQVYSQTDQAQATLAYWQKVIHPPVSSLPVDIVADLAENTEASADTITVSLSKTHTQHLLQDIGPVYRTEINDILLTALGQALKGWTGADVLRFDLEGHGREDLFDKVDISRTVGWFTSLFPVCLDLSTVDEAGRAIQSVKEQLRAIPARGIHWGILSHLSPVADQLQSPARPIIFNYLGQFDQVFNQSSLFEPTRDFGGHPQGQGNQRAHLLEINAIVINHQLHVDWIYSQNIHHPTTINTLANNFMSALVDLIDHCLHPEAGGYTPSDFPLANLTQTKLAHLAELILKADDADETE